MIDKKKFSELCSEFRSGTLDDDLTDELHQLSAEVMATGKPGSITLKISMKKTGEYSIDVTEAVAVKHPPRHATGKTYFVGIEGNLTNRHPDQPPLSAQFDQKA